MVCALPFSRPASAVAPTCGSPHCIVPMSIYRYSFDIACSSVLAQASCRECEWERLQLEARAILQSCAESPIVAIQSSAICRAQPALATSLPVPQAHAEPIEAREIDVGRVFLILLGLQVRSEPLNIMACFGIRKILSIHNPPIRSCLRADGLTRRLVQFLGSNSLQLQFESAWCVQL